MRLFHPEGPSFGELTVQALSSLEKGYDRLAPRFDHTPFRTPDDIVEASLGGIPPVGSALDLCCGTGAASRILRDIAEEVVGVDLSEGMLDVARAHAPGATFRQENALDLPNDLAPSDGSGRFDLVVSFGAFGHFERHEQPRLIDSVRRALRVGGRFVFVTADPPPLTSPSRWIAHAFNGAMRVRNALWHPPFVMYYLTFLLPRAREVLEDAGFEVVVEEGRFPEHPQLVNVVATRRA